MNLTCQAPFTLPRVQFFSDHGETWWGAHLGLRSRPNSFIGDLRITKIVVLPNQDGLLTDLWKFKSDWRTLLIVVAIKSSVHLWWLIWVFSAIPPQLLNPSDLPCWEMAVAITCGYGGYLLPLLAAHSSLRKDFNYTLRINVDKWHKM